MSDQRPRATDQRRSRTPRTPPGGPHVSRFRTWEPADGERELPPSRRGRETLRAFEEAARRVIGRQGFLRTTVNDIAAEAGKSPATFYTYFNSKEDLLGHLADHLGHEILVRSGLPSMPGDAPYEWFEAAAGAYWDTFVENLGVFVGIFQLGMLEDSFTERWRELGRVGVRVIRESIVDANRLGLTTLDPTYGASAIGSMFEHFCYVWLAHNGDLLPGEPPSREHAVATLATIWYRALH